MSARALLKRAAGLIGRTQGTGGSTWTRTRVVGGDPATDATTETTPDQPLYFVENNPAKAGQALPATALYSAPFWGIAALGVDVQVSDVFDNGTIAFLITGAPDTSQGFQRIPAAVTTVPANHARRTLAQGLRTGLRIGLA